MEWETLDSVDNVASFYGSKLQQSGWTISFATDASGGSYSANFHWAADSSLAGILGVDGRSGVTKISMSFASPG